jgi:hypothetical protein
MIAPFEAYEELHEQYRSAERKIQEHEPFSIFFESILVHSI